MNNKEKTILERLSNTLAGTLAGAILGLFFYIVTKLIIIFIVWDIVSTGSLEVMRMYMGIGAFIAFLYEILNCPSSSLGGKN